MTTNDLLILLLFILIACLVYQCIRRSLREGDINSSLKTRITNYDQIPRENGGDESCKNGKRLTYCNWEKWNSSIIE